MAAVEVRIGGDLRLAELLAALSLAGDLGMNLPPESALRNALVAVGLSRRIGLDADQQSDVYYLSLLHHVGCTGAAVYAAQLADGDDRSVFGAYASADYDDRVAILGKSLGGLGGSQGPLRRARTTFNLLSQGWSTIKDMQAASCEAASRLAARLGMTAGVGAGLYQVFTRWDGKVFPPPSGEAISLTARVVHVAHVAESFHRVAGRQVAAEIVRRRSGTELDPGVAQVFLRDPDRLLSPAEPPSVWDQALAAEPEPQRHVPPFRLEEIASAFGDFADLKSPFMLGHSRAVAELAGRAGEVLRIDRDDVEGTRIAAHLHDLGQVSVPNGIWEKQGRLNAGEFERVRLHPYYTERILSHSPLLARHGEVAGMHHERLDGSGYHRGLRAAGIPTSARLLATADMYHALLTDGPHRPALAPGEAAAALEREAVKGSLDREVVDATIVAAGQPVSRHRSSWPASLTDREIEVLRRVAAGESNKAIARTLFISEATVHTHVLNIYGKLGVNSRAGAALFAMEHDLIRT